MKPNPVAPDEATTTPVAPAGRRSLTSEDISVRRPDTKKTGPRVSANGQNQQNYQNN